MKSYNHDDKYSTKLCQKHCKKVIDSGYIRGKLTISFCQVIVSMNVSKYQENHPFELENRPIFSNLIVIFYSGSSNQTGT